MADGITQQSKDATFKFLAQEYKDKSFDVLGLKNTKIKEFLSTQFPVIIAGEIRADNIFLLKDGSILIVDYESDVKTGDFIKYCGYIYSVLNYYYKTEKKRYQVRMAVIYTGDTTSTADHYDFGSLTIKIEQVFLANLNTADWFDNLRQKVESNSDLTDEDVIRFTVLPLTEPNKPQRQSIIEKTIDLAKRVNNEQHRNFIISGILITTNNIIDKDYAQQIKEWLSMTQVAQLIAEEAAEKANEKLKREIALKLLAAGVPIETIADSTNLPEDKIELLKDEPNQP